MSKKKDVLNLASSVFQNEQNAEKRLMYAVLKQAVDDIFLPGRYGREAREYIFNQQEDHLFSFDSICEQLDFSAKTLRDELLRQIICCDTTKKKPSDTKH